MKYSIISLVLLFMSGGLYAQDCQFKLHGSIFDEDNDALPEIDVKLIHNNDSTDIITSDDGTFEVNNLCAGKYAIYIGEHDFQKVIKNIEISQDTTLTLHVHSKNENLEEEVLIKGNVNRNAIQTVATDALTGKALFNTRGETLGEALKNISGVNAVSTGPTISKPMIHGMYGQRVLIVNNGVRQEGQQWSNDHAPELDPFISNKITVVKGAASVRYGSDAEGGVVLMDAPELPSKKGINGEVYLLGSTNSRGGALSANIQNAIVDTAHQNTFAWRAQGTLKGGGNYKTPHYYLDNTGTREGDYSLNAAFTHKNWDVNVWYSEYRFKAGIFSGAESGNEAELLEKFALSEPLTPNVFSYKIKKDYQAVYHNLLKGAFNYHLNNGDAFHINYAYQTDDRKEYSADEPYNPAQAAKNLPQVQFEMETHTGELIYERKLRNNWAGSFGFTGMTQGNANSFNGITTLLPNFRTYTGGIYGIAQYYLGPLTLEAGLRGDYERMNVYKYQNFSHFNYGNGTGTIGANYALTPWLSAKLNSGLAWRAPSVSEMFINGTHLADAMYMIGDSSLKSEHAWNNVLSLNVNTHKLTITADLYWNHINNYIYAKPLPDPIILVSGAFLGFKYTQSNVDIKGLDLDIRYDVAPWLTIASKESFVRGYNNSENNYLIYMPADRFQNGLDFHLAKLGAFNAPYFEIENVSVRHQNRFPANEDFVNPPKAYTLFNATIGFDIPFGKTTLTTSLSATNFTNTAYRDYLDMFRYYNDALGANYTLRFRWAF